MMYNETVLDHFANPRNAGKLENASARGETGNPSDGDRIIIYVRIQANHLQEVRFQTFGCAAAIAASSMLTVLATGKTIEDASRITNEDVAEALGGLPPEKSECSNIAADALQKALAQYQEDADRDETDSNTNSSGDSCQINMHESAMQQASGLTPDQIQRYMRQIIMPEISGKGQQILLQTHIAVWMPSVSWGEMLLAYLAAVGFGHITCVLDEVESGKAILDHVQDLNPELQWLVQESSEADSDLLISSSNAALVLGPPNWVGSCHQKLSEQIGSQPPDFPLLSVAIRPWAGVLTSSISQPMVQHHRDQGEKDPVGTILSASFAGTMSVIQLVKARLGIGQSPKKPFQYNLMDMTFEETTEFNKYCSLRPDYQRLSRSSVLLIGSGGLGSPSAFVLAKAGIGTLGLVDYDEVDLSNLNRQILHTTSRIGMPKVVSGAKTLQMLNPQITVNTYQEQLTEDNADMLLEKYDLLLDGLDNMPARYVANKAAAAASKPFVHAGVLSFYGQASTIVPGQGHCLECVFPQSEGEGNFPTCEEMGVLGAAPGLMGVIQAAETIKQLTGLPPSLQHRFLMVDTLETEFTLVDLSDREDCPVCSTKR